MKILGNFPLDSRVLAVAVEGNVHDWSCYIGAVDGINHDHEQYEVAKTGNKLPYEIAKIIFPELVEKYVWRS